jgi:hypothetical protein
VLLYETLLATGFARGRYEAHPDDELQLVDCAISNAVRCAPPENKPLGSEEANCRPFLAARIAAYPRLRAHRDARRRQPPQRAARARRQASAAAPGHGRDHRRRTLPRLQQLPLQPPQHAHRPPDARDVPRVFDAVRAYLG